MDDRKLLECAAAAAGIEIATWSNCQPGGFVKGESGVFWNPLTNDGDALKLAVKLKFQIDVRTLLVCVEQIGACTAPAQEQIGDDPYASTRRAIVRAAASLKQNALDKRSDAALSRPVD